MKRRYVVAILCALLLTVLSMNLWGTIAERPAGAASSPPSGPTEEVLAIVSPIVYPVCSASGLSTLLVPVVGGLLDNDLHLPSSVNISDIILNSLGPVFVVCGDLPAPKGSQCIIDTEVVAIWPKELNTFGVEAPAPVGSVVDSIEAALSALDLPLSSSLNQALHCSVPAAETAPAPVGTAAPAPAPTPGTTTTSDEPTSLGNGLPTFDTPTSGAILSPVTSSPPAESLAPKSRAQALHPITSVVDLLPWRVRFLQVALAIILAALLTASWLTSWRVKAKQRAA